MSIGIVVQFATLAVLIGIGICAIYTIFEMRNAHTGQQEQFVRAASVIEEFHKVQPELLSLLKRIESDGHALQSIAMQIESAVATLRDTAFSSIKFAGDRQIAAIETFRDHLDTQEQNLSKIVQLLSQTVGKTDSGDYLRLRKEIVTTDPNVRFAVLKDWVTLNWLAILRRASRGWNTPADLIANVPPYLEPEAEVLEGSALVLGTRAHPHRLAVPIRDIDPSSELHQWFDTSDQSNGVRHRPALLIRSNDHFELISKGSPHEVVSGRADI